MFAAADTLEFQGAGPAGAIRVLNELANAKDPAVRGGALVRLARNYRKTGDSPRALATFGELSKLGDTPVNGLPAGLLARQGSALILEALGRHDELKREAAVLDADLRNGRWRLTRAFYKFAKEQVRRWVGDGSPRPEDRNRLALAAAAESVWKEWQATGRAEANTRARRTLWAGNQSVLVVSRSSAGRLVVSLAGAHFGAGQIPHSGTTARRHQEFGLCGSAPLRFPTSPTLREAGP